MLSYKYMKSLKIAISTMLLIAFSSVMFLNEAVSAEKSPTYYASEGASTITVPEGPDLFEVVKNLLNTTFSVVGVIAVIMMIIGGFHYMTSQGSPEKVQKGKNTILYGIIGMIIVLSAFAIVNFVLDGLSKK